MTRISIVTISFNQRDFLGACIDSVLGQRYPNLDYVVVDPGSTDGSRELIRSYGNALRYVFEPDEGPADGLNRGFKIADGEVFAFINSDDFLLPSALETVARHFQLESPPDVLCGQGFIIDQHGARLRRVVPSRFTSWMYAYGAVSVFQQGTFFTADIFQRVGGFNKHNVTCWDGELFLEFALHGGKFKLIEECLAAFRFHPGGISGSGRLQKQYETDSRRLFQRVTGRQFTAGDHVLGWGARLLKPILTPGYLKAKWTGVNLV